MANLILKGNTSGQVTIQAPDEAGTTTLTLPTTNSTLATQNALGVRNLIINGDMRIAQRGTSYTLTSNNYGSLDRWNGSGSGGPTLVMSQETDVPTGQGFKNSLKVTVSTGATIDATDYSDVRQYIEGQNVSHLDWGTANAKSVTISFWVKSSLTGTFAVSFVNDGYDECYPATYTINSANTWEKKTITIAGDTTGTWLTTNGVGIRVVWDLGVGSTYSRTVNQWNTGYAGFGGTGTTKLAATTGATFYITGVQLEVGDTATPFEHRPYDMELARCMRYYWKTQTGNTNTTLFAGQTPNTTQIWYGGSLPVPMRSTPSTSVTGSLRGYVANGYKDLTTIISNRCSPSNVGLSFSTTGVTAGQGSVLYSPDATGSVIFDSEL